MNFNILSDKLEKIYKNYEHRPEIIKKIDEYLSKQLPHALLLYIERINRKQELEKNSELYIDKFLNNPEKQYFYIQYSNIFIFYNGINYKVINEDDIWHAILSDISTQKELVSWKHKIKNSIIKKIKEKTITQSIPESCTIQHIIQHLTPTLFKTKSEVKYFLTIIGDKILKKQSTKIHFARLESHEFLSFLQDHVQCILGKNCLLCQSVQYKYYNQDYKECRILNFNESIKIKNCWDSFIKSNVLNLIAVSTHYSNQFQNAETYISKKCQDEEVIRTICYLSNTNSNFLIELFTSSWFETSNNGEITWSEMYYLWKSFIRTECDLPIMPIFMKNLKSQLSTKFNYNESTASFTMIMSSKLLYVKTFHDFWNATIESGDDEFEISEIWSLYLYWLHQQNGETNGINEEKIHFLIEHFSKSSIINGKTVLNIKCNLWDKQCEMNEILNQLKVDYNFYQDDDISIYKLYKDYCSKILESTNGKTVSKKYFEKYITRMIPVKYIKENQLLKEYWTTF